MNQIDLEQAVTDKDSLIQGLLTALKTRPRDRTKVINLASDAADLEVAIAKHHMEDCEPYNALISLRSAVSLLETVRDPEEKPLQLEIHTDEDSEDPHGDDGQWTLYGFNPNKLHYAHPDDHGITREGTSDDEEIQKKLDEGLAFIVSYYEHGDCVWFVKGQGAPGSDCPWDGVTVAGVLIWEHDADDMGAKTYEERGKDAAAFLAIYTNWCNGHVYGFMLESPEGAAQCAEPVDSCFGFYELDYMFDVIREAADGREVEVHGELASLADGVDFSTPVKEDETAGVTT